MAEFAYNNAKNLTTGYTPFKLNYDYYPKVLFKKNLNLYFKSYFADKLAKELRELIEICCQNLLYIQELQKKAHNKGAKNCNYTPGKKI